MGISFKDYLPQDRDARILAVAMLVNAIGSGMFLAGGTLFFVRVVGLSYGQLAVGLSIAAAFGIVATIPISAMADRFAPRSVLSMLYLLRALSFAGLAFAGGPVGFTLLACCQTATNNAAMPIFQALAGDIAGKQSRLSIMAQIRSIRNIGFSLGSLAATPLLAVDDLWLNRSLLIGTALALVASGLFLLLLRASRLQETTRRRHPLASLAVVGDLRYSALTLLNTFMVMHMTLLAVGLPLWVHDNEAVPDAIVPLMLTLNTVMAVVLQVPITKRVTDLAAGIRAMRLAGLALAATMTLLSLQWADQRLWFGLAVIVCAYVTLTMAELWQSAGGWELSYVLAVTETRAAHLGLFNLSVSAQELLGPLLVAAALGAGAFGWLGFAVLFLGGALATGPVVRALERSRREQTALANA